MNTVFLTFRRGSFVVLVVWLCAAGGCSPFDTVASRDESRDREANPPTAKPPRLDEDRHRQLDQAMAGLIYGTERVVVDPKQARPFEDAASAQHWIELGQALLDAGDRLESVRAFTRGVLSAPSASSAYVALADALVANHRTVQALAAFRTAVHLDEGNVAARMGLGIVLERLGRRNAAIETYTALVARDPSHGQAHARLAVLIALSGDLTTAERHLEHARAADASVPRQVEARIGGASPPPAIVRHVSFDQPARAPLIGPQVRLDVGGGAGPADETTAVADVSEPGVVVAGWNDYRDGVGTGFATSLDGGATWTDQLVRPPIVNQGLGEFDPMTAYDPRTGTIWVGGTTAAGDDSGVYIARKQPGVAAFDPSAMAVVIPTADKAWMAAGRPPQTPDATHLYVAFSYHLSGILLDVGLSTSTDLGATWNPFLPLGMGISGLPRVGPQGELYVSYWDFGDGILVRTSLDGGSSIGAPVTAAVRVESADDIGHLIPGTFRVFPLAGMAVDPVSGRVYITFPDATSASRGETDIDIYLTYSDDGAGTWSIPQVLPVPGDQFFPWLEVDETGRLHLVFLDTRNTPQLDSDQIAFIDAYYAYSEDSGLSWFETRLTSEAWSSATTGGTQFLGDYLGMAVAGSRVYPVYLSTQNGNSDIFSNVITFPEQAYFADGFESGDTSAWADVEP